MIGVKIVKLQNTTTNCFLYMAKQELGAEIWPQEVHSLHSNSALVVAFKLPTLVVKSCA